MKVFLDTNVFLDYIQQRHKVGRRLRQSSF